MVEILSEVTAVVLTKHEHQSTNLCVIDQNGAALLHEETDGHEDKD